LRDLAAVLEALDEATRGTGITATGHQSSAVTIPAERNAAQAHDVVLGLTYNDALRAHVIEFEG
jgi:hypothetical protein